MKNYSIRIQPVANPRMQRNQIRTVGLVGLTDFFAEAHTTWTVEIIKIFLLTFESWEVLNGIFTNKNI